jgi:hypothetical protein
MRLGESTRDSIELKIRGYEFPRETWDYYDANWLLIEIDATKDGRPWKRTDPTLTTFEMVELCEWLDAVANGSPVEELGFTEPCYRFRLDRDIEQVLKIQLELEVRPPWMASNKAYENDCLLAIPVTRESITVMARSLREELQPFPVRGEATKPELLNVLPKVPPEVKTGEHLRRRVTDRLKDLFR